MKLKNLYAQIEDELKWRQDEIRFFQNIYGLSLLTEDQKNQTGRSLILLLYAHFEGFTKFTLSVYVDAINKANISCKNADYAIVADTLSRVFSDMRNPDRKTPEFKHSLPEDTKLHRIARDKEFVERTDDIKNVKVVIPDNYVDTESNLKPVVLRKNLFKLGFDYSGLDAVEGSIQKLLGYRNDIAHGTKKDGISKSEYDDILKDTYTVMNYIKSLVYNSLRDKKFKRTTK